MASGKESRNLYNRRSLLKHKNLMRRHLRDVLKEEKIRPAQLEQEDIDMLVVSADYDDGNWRHQLAKVLHSIPVTIVVVILVLLDCAFVIAELYIDIAIISESGVRTEGDSHDITCHGNVTSGHDDDHAHNDTSPDVHATINPHKANHDHHGHDVRVHIAHGFHYGSIAILCLFCVEIILRLIAMGPKKFIKSKVEVIDSVVILGSLLMDIVALFYNSGTNFLVFIFVMLLWRFIRILNTLLATYKRRVKLRYELQRLTRRRAETRLKAANEKIKMLQEELKNVVTLAKVKGASTDELSKCKPVDRRATGIFLKSAVKSLMGTVGLMSPYAPASHHHPQHHHHSPKALQKQLSALAGPALPNGAPAANGDVRPPPPPELPALTEVASSQEPRFRAVADDRPSRPHSFASSVDSMVTCLDYDEDELKLLDGNDDTFNDCH